MRQEQPLRQASIERRRTGITMGWQPGLLPAWHAEVREPGVDVLVFAAVRMIRNTRLVMEFSLLACQPSQALLRGFSQI